MNLQAARVLINVDVPWTPARLEQRIGRIARLGQLSREVDVYNIWYPHSVEARMYARINSRLRNTNIAVGEFPEIIATGILSSVLNGLDDNSSIDELRNIRNNSQVRALEELWDYDNPSVTTSNITRKRLIQICQKEFTETNTVQDGRIHTFVLPDGTSIDLSAESGLEESVSYLALPIRMLSFNISGVSVEFGKNNKPVVFKYKGRDIKHEAVLKLILGEILTENDYLVKYPVMLPNPQKITLQLATDCDVNNKPSYWK